MADPLVTDPQETVKKLLHKALKAGVDKGRLTNIKMISQWNYVVEGYR